MGRITHNYDVVIGPVAEDSVYRIIKLFEIGEITVDEAIVRLKTVPLHGQVVFHTAVAIRKLVFIGSWEV